MSLGSSELQVSARPDSGPVLATPDENQSVPPRLMSEPVDRRIQVVVMLLKNNLQRQIPMVEVAELVNLSPGRLAHLFKREMALSIQQYVTQLRLARAKDHLETSFLSVKEIAALVGFQSVTRFVGCFKSVVGSTPAQYRKYLTRVPNIEAPVSIRSKMRKEIAGPRINSRIRQ